MTGPEHYREAERLLAETDGGARLNSAALRADAQIHATLALAAATALSRYNPEAGFVEADRRAWYVAASDGPAEKQRQREAEAAEAHETAEYFKEVNAGYNAAMGTGVTR